MSTATPETPSTPSPPGGWGLGLRVFSVVAALGSVVALWIGERAKADHDLQLIVQNQAKPGETVALRVLLFRGLEAITGPRLTTDPVVVRLTDTSGEELARSRLSPSDTVTMEGALRIPDLPAGSYVLDARAQLDGHLPARCRKALRVDPEGGRLTPFGRVAGGLQQFVQGRLRRVSEDHPPPVPFDARIPGGVCLPEQECEVWVRVGEPAAAIDAWSSEAVKVVEGPEPRGETQGLVRLSVVVHGPEAELVVRALRQGQPVAERSLRLPVGLGEVALNVERPVLDPGEPVSVRAATPPGRKALIFDAYRGGDWLHTRTVPVGDPDDWGPAPLPELGEGLWRLQARVDPFSAEGAGARMVYVRPPGMDDVQLLRRLDRLATLTGEAQVFADERPAPAWALADVQRTAAYLLAPLERSRMPQPVAVSGRPAQLRRLGRTRNILRFGVAAMLVMAAFVVSGTMVRRELGEQADARDALRAAGDLTVDTPENRRRQRNWAVGMALGVAMAFLVAALLIVAKPLWF